MAATLVSARIDSPQSGWSDVIRDTVPQTRLSTYGTLSQLSKAEVDPPNDPDAPRTDLPDLIMGGYGSPQVVDQQQQLITKEAMARDLPRFLAVPEFRNSNLLHTNIQVATVLPHWRDPDTGTLYSTKVDDVGLFVVVKVRTDRFRPPVMDEVIRDIKNGKLAAFSISADAPFDARRHVCKDGTCFYVIDRVYFYEITICFPGKERVWTKRGLIPISEVQVGDQVWTHMNRWRSVTKTMSRYNTSPIIRITTEDGMIAATPEHPFRVLSYGGQHNGTKYIWKAAKDVEAGDVISRHTPFAFCRACGAPIFTPKFNNTRDPNNSFCNHQCKAKLPNRKGKKQPPGWNDHLKGLRHPGKGGIKTPEGRARQIAGVTSNAFRAKAVERATRQWKDPAYVRSQMRARSVRPNKLEQAFGDFLLRYGFHYTGDGEHVVAGKCPDYWNGDHKLIELYGDFWHQGQDPNDRIHLFRQHGYETLIIWESELLHKADEVQQRVEEFVGNAQVRVLTTLYVPHDGLVYNLSVEEDESYTMEEAVVHNCSKPVNQRALATILTKSATSLTLADEYAPFALCEDGSCYLPNYTVAQISNAQRSLDDELQKKYESIIAGFRHR